MSESQEFLAYRRTSSDCHEYAGRKNEKGYGRVWHRGKQHYAHRLSLARHLGRDLLPTEIVLHSCDNPACINPDHLSIGTQSHNCKDALAKGRFAIKNLGKPERCSVEKATMTARLEAGESVESLHERRACLGLRCVAGDNARN